MNSSDYSSEIINLEQNNEFNFTVCNHGQKITLQLLEGSAEVFGSQLLINKSYEFSYFSSVNIFTLCGCTLKVTKSSSSIKCKIKAFETVPKIKELHEHLESLRANAQRRNSCPPITLVIGPTDVGKSTLCRYLINYAAIQGRSPTYIDLDVGQSSMSIPGTFGVLPAYEPSNVNGKFNERLLSVYYFGYKSPGHHMELYKLILKKVGRRLKNRLMYGSNSFKKSGVIIDTCGWVKGQGYELITEIIRTLEVNVILVVGDNILYSKLVKNLSKQAEIISVPGLDTFYRNKTVRWNIRNSSVLDYFYGSQQILQPYTIKVNFSDLQIYKAKSCIKNISSSISDELNSNVTLIPIEPSILNQVLGLSYAEYVEDILWTSVYGFVCLVDLNMNSNVASLLSPQPGPLPTKHLLMGDMLLNLDRF